MEFNDLNNDIYKVFSTEYKCSPSYNSLGKGWPEFVYFKDLGIECVFYFNFLTNSTYKIVDVKKWVLNKLRYGI